MSRLPAVKGGDLTGYNDYLSCALVRQLYGKPRRMEGFKVD